MHSIVIKTFLHIDLEIFYDIIIKIITAVI
jgi:hypothetical protein